MTFGEKLQRLRQKAGLSQDALAERLDVSRQAVSRWERNETMPETDKIVLMAEMFSVTTDYLLRDMPEKAEAAVEKQGGSWNRLGYLLQTKGYLLLGWVLIIWGLMDLLPYLVLALFGITNFALF